MQTGGRRSASSPTSTAKRSTASPSAPEAPRGGFPLSGPSAHPDPRTHAFRQDLADVALAGTVIASHYAEPLARTLISAASLLAEPDHRSEVLAELPAGTSMKVLDKSRGWAWGYAEGLVGYVPASAFAPC